MTEDFVKIIGYLFGVVGIIIFTALLAREVWCWYSKINIAMKKVDEIIEAHKQTNFWLERIAVGLHYRNAANGVNVPEDYKYKN